MKYLVAILILLATDLIAQVNWMQTNGPNGGFVHKIIVDSSGNYYAGTLLSVVYRSSDKGLHWEELNEGLIGNELLTLACTSDSQIYAGTDYAGLNKLNVAIGAWAGDDLKVNRISAILKTNKGTLLIGTLSTGLYRIDSEGDSAYESNSGIAQKNIKSIIQIANGDLYLIAKAFNCYRSTDDGKTWTQILYLTDQSYGQVAALYATKNVNNGVSLFVGTLSNIVGEGGLFRSTDNGASWDTVFRRATYDVISLNETLFLSSYEDMLRSDDGGNTWRSFKRGLTCPYILSFTVTKDHDLLGGSYGGGVYVLQREDSVWRALTVGFPNAYVIDIAIRNDTIFSGTRFAGVSYSFDGGVSWVQSSYGLESEYITKLVATDGPIYAGTSNGVYLSNDGSKSWKRISGITGFVTTMICSRLNKIYVSTYDSNYYISLGDTVGHVLIHEEPTFLTVLHNGPSDVLYALGHFDYFINGNNVGLHGLFTSKGDSTGFKFKNEVKVDEYRGMGTIDTIMLYSGKNVMRSTNYGYKWENTIVPPYNGNTFLNIKDKLVLCGTDASGVYMSADSGKSWTGINTGLTNAEVTSLALDSEGYAYLGSGDETKSKGGGIFKTSLSLTKLAVRSQKSIGKAKSLFINQNNQSLVLDDPIIEISILNILGKQVYVKKTFDRTLTLNLYETLDQSGLYIVKIRTDTGMQSISLLLQK